MTTLAPPRGVYDGWPSFSGARNVAHLYVMIAEDVRTGSLKAPNFEDGGALHDLIGRVERSAQANKINNKPQSNGLTADRTPEYTAKIQQYI